MATCWPHRKCIAIHIEKKNSCNVAKKVFKSAFKKLPLKVYYTILQTLYQSYTIFHFFGKVHKLDSFLQHKTVQTQQRILMWNILSLKSTQCINHVVLITGITEAPKPPFKLQKCRVQIILKPIRFM